MVLQNWAAGVNAFHLITCLILFPHDWLDNNYVEVTTLSRKASSVSCIVLVDCLQPNSFENGIAPYVLGGQGNFNWTLFQGSTGSIGTGPTVDHTLGNSLGRTLTRTTWPIPLCTFSRLLRVTWLCTSGLQPSIWSDRLVVMCTLPRVLNTTHKSVETCHLMFCHVECLLEVVVHSPCAVCHVATLIPFTVGTYMHGKGDRLLIPFSGSQANMFTLRHRSHVAKVTQHTWPHHRSQQQVPAVRLPSGITCMEEPSENWQSIFSVVELVLQLGWRMVTRATRGSQQVCWYQLLPGTPSRYCQLEHVCSRF